MELIDTHAHLTYEGLSNQLDAVLARAAEHHVGRIITVASDADDAERCLEIANSHDTVFATAGIHPHEAAKVRSGDYERIARLLTESRVVAVGEIGLDYYYDFADRDTQKRVFAAQLELARSTDLPLVIHCREAFGDCIAALKQYGYSRRRVVFHCFSGTREEAERVAAEGWRISFTGMVTFKKLTELQSIAKTYPFDRLMLETDSPYLSPEPVRHMRPNEPANVHHTARFLAGLRGESVDDLAAQTTANAREFFALE